MAEEVVGQGSQPVTFRGTDEPSPGFRQANGKTLRREFVYAERKKYIEDKNDPDYIFIEAKEEGKIKAWKEEALIKYPSDGVYIVNINDGTFEEFIDNGPPTEEEEVPK